MEISPAILALIGVAVVGAIGIAFGYGMLTRSVNGNRLDIDHNKKDFNDALHDFREENAASHKTIHEKLDNIVANGKGKA